MINRWCYSKLAKLKKVTAGSIIDFELYEGLEDTTVAAGCACGPVT